MDDSVAAEWTICSGAMCATLTARGAFLRRLTHHGVDLISTFPSGTTPVMMDGAQLAPWPGRIANGRWQVDGQVHELPITEPARHNAIHGLVHALDWELVDHASDRLQLTTLLEECVGWPGAMRFELDARVADDEFRLTLRATNLAERPLPFGWGSHPYVRLDGTPRSAWTLEVPFDQVLAVDPDRLLPLRLEPVDAAGSDLPDLRHPHSLEGHGLDNAFTAPHRDADDWWWVTVAHGDRRVRVGSPDMDWVQLYTPDDPTLLAIEPMSLGADGFNRGPGGAGLVVLGPGQQQAFTWAVRAG